MKTKYMNIISQLQNNISDVLIKANEPLAPYTTVRIGGSADYFAEVKNVEVLTQLLKNAFSLNIPITMLGWGANTLIADRGIKGLVIRNQANNWRIISPKEFSDDIKDWDGEKNQQNDFAETTRYKALDSKQDFLELDYDESNYEHEYILVESGAALPVLITQTIIQGLTGLQWFARIPSTLGGAIVNNIHGGSHFLGEFVIAVQVINDEGNIYWLKANELKFGYDTSRFHQSNEIILQVILRLYKGEKNKALQVARHWAEKKAHQPQRSLGCIFHNLTSENQKSLGLPTPSVGYFIEHKLKLKGLQIGDARISNHHAAFIENLGYATAEDYLSVIQTIVTSAKNQFGITLIPEIFFKGFTQEELAFFHQ